MATPYAVLTSMASALSSPAWGATTVPTADVVAGAEALPDLGYLEHADGPCTKTFDKVSPLQAFVNGLVAGDVGCIPPGTYQVSALVIDGRAVGTADKPIVLRAQVPWDRPVIVATASRKDLLTIRPTVADVAYWVIDGLVLDKGGTSGSVVRLEGTATRSVRRVALRNSEMRKARTPVTDAISTNGVHIAAGVADVFVAYNTIHDVYRDDPSTDANGIAVTGKTGVPPAQRLLFKGNTIRRFGSDGFHCEGPNYNTGLSDADPRDITFEDNTVVEEASSNLDLNAENGIDLKACQRVTLRGVPIHELGSDGRPGMGSARVSGFRKSTRAGQAEASGDAIAIEFWSRSVLVEGLVVADSCYAITQPHPTMPVQDVVIRRNVIRDLAPDPSVDRGRCTNRFDRGAIVMGGGVVRADIHGNVMSNVGLRGATLCTGTAGCTDVDYFGNVVDGAESYLTTGTTRGLFAGGNLYGGAGRSGSVAAEAESLEVPSVPVYCADPPGRERPPAPCPGSRPRR